MLAAIRQHWKDFKASPPGSRFQDIHKKRSKKKGNGSGFRKWGLIALGVALCLAGLFFMAVPGPGTLVLALGLVLMAGESSTMARLLDWLELKLRPYYLRTKARWKKADPKARLALKVSSTLAGLAVVVAAGYWYFFMR